MIYSSLLVIMGIFLIYVTNRIVTRPYVSKAGGEQVASAVGAKKTVNKNKKIEINEKQLPEGSAEDWNLLLVNPTHPLKEDRSSEAFVTLANGMMLDKRIETAYSQLESAAREAGFPLVLVSSYRSISYQEQIFQDYLNDWLNQGYSEEEALAKVKETSTEPGFSEHHTGLAIDVVDENWSTNYPKEMLEESYAETPGGKWLAEHAREYGFILRYPKGKEEQTTIHFEPWHFRYVGVDHAKYIEENQLSLEEYLDLLKEK